MNQYQRCTSIPFLSTVATTLVVLLIASGCAPTKRPATESERPSFAVPASCPPREEMVDRPVCVEIESPRLAEHYLDAVTAKLTNFALAKSGATIKATAERNAVAGLLDDDPATGYDAPFSQERVSLELTLPKPETFDCLYWNRSRGEPMSEREPRDYDISVSDDGQAWRMVKQVRGFRGQFNYERFDPVTARRLRLDILKTSGGDGVVIWELRLHNVGAATAPDWAVKDAQWRLRLPPAVLPASDRPQVVRTAVDFAHVETRPGRHVRTDAIRVVEGSMDLPARFSPDENALLWIAPPAATNQPRAFEVYFAWNDEPAPASPARPIGASVAMFDDYNRPAVETLRFIAGQAPAALRCEEIAPRGGAPTQSGTFPQGGSATPWRERIISQPFGYYWALDAQGKAAWLPRDLKAAGTVSVSLPRAVWARGETVPVRVSLPANSPATAVELALTHPNLPVARTVTVALDASKTGSAAIPTDALAQGQYRLVAIARDAAGVLDAPIRSLTLVQPRESFFPYGFYCRPDPLGPQPREAGWKMLNDLNARLILESDADTALRYRMQTVAKIQNLDADLHASEGDASAYVVTSNGRVLNTKESARLCLMHPRAQDRYTGALRNLIQRYRNHPGFSKTIFWRDDNQLAWDGAPGNNLPGENDDHREKWFPSDYNVLCKTAFKAKTGHEPPVPTDLPKRTGIVPDNDPWIEWINFRLDDYYAGLARQMRDVKNGLAPEIRLVPIVGGGGPNPYTAISDGLYPPYDQAAADFVNTYYYPGNYWPSLDYLWQVQLGWMGNRGRPTWMTTGLDVPWAPDAIRNKFHLLLAAGYNGIIQYCDNPYMWNPKEPAYQVLRGLGQLVDDYEALYCALQPATPRVAVLYPLTSVAYGFTGELFDYTNQRNFETLARTLVRNHIPMAAVAEEEVQAGILDQFDVLVIPEIQALRKSVADRITAAAAAGKPVWMLNGSQVELPGVQRVALGGIVPALHGQPAARRLLTPDTTDVVVGDLRVGRTPFVYLVNCYSDRWRGRTGGAFGIFYPLDPDPYLQIWPYIEERPGSQSRPTKAVTTHLANADPTLTFYDLYAHRQLTSLDVELAPADGKLLAGYRQPLGKTRLEAAESATQGRPVIVRIQVQDGAGKPFTEPVPIKFTVRGPDGQASVYSHSVLAQNGVAEVRLPFAINDAPGRWMLDAVNLANGDRAEAAVSLHPNSGAKE